MKRIIIAILLLGMIACQQQAGEETAISSPFIGGTQGLEINFQDFRNQVFDGGEDPFDIIVQVENEGEAEVNKQDAQMKITGINPAEFGVDPTQLKSQLPDDLIEMRKTPEGQIMESPPTFVEFTGLNYAGKIAGATTNYPIRADLCYRYETTAVSQLCIRENLLNPREGGICEPIGTKPTFSSGAPVQITNVQQVVRSRDKLAFSFDITNPGTGEIYKRGTKCDKTRRADENKVFLTVETGINGLQCTGLTGGGTVAQGEVTLYGGSKTVSCTQQAASSTDYKQIITITAEYDYEQTAQTTLTVKSSGE